MAFLFLTSRRSPNRFPVSAVPGGTLRNLESAGDRKRWFMLSAHKISITCRTLLCFKSRRTTDSDADLGVKKSPSAEQPFLAPRGSRERQGTGA